MRTKQRLTKPAICPKLRSTPPVFLLKRFCAWRWILGVLLQRKSRMYDHRGSCFGTKCGRNVKNHLQISYYGVSLNKVFFPMSKTLPIPRQNLRQVFFRIAACDDWASRHSKCTHTAGKSIFVRASRACAFS